MGKASRKRRDKNKRQQPIIHESGPWAEVADAVSDRDRAWFLAHPSQAVYARKRVPGEFGPRDGDPEVQEATHVEVTQLAPGVRARKPIALMRRHDYPAGRIPFEHFEAFVAAHTGTVDGLRTYTDEQIDDH